MKLEFTQQIFGKKNPPNIKFHENPSCGSPVVSCGRMDGQTDLTKLTVTFRDISKSAYDAHKVRIEYHVK